MAFKTFTSGSVLTASDVNTYLAKQAVVVCTSTTRPSSPPEGMVIYETDTDKLLAYTTATTGWVPPWNMPWGVVGVAGPASNTAVSTTATTILTASSVSIVANRRYRVSAVVGLSANVTGNHTHTIKRGTTTIATSTARHSAGTIDYSTTALMTLDSAATGSYTYTLVTTMASSTGTVDGGSTTCYLMVEDIGPSGAPA